MLNTRPLIICNFIIKMGIWTLSKGKKSIKNIYHTLTGCSLIAALLTLAVFPRPQLYGTFKITKLETMEVALLILHVYNAILWHWNKCSTFSKPNSGKISVVISSERAKIRHRTILKNKYWMVQYQTQYGNVEYHILLYLPAIWV